MNEEVMEQVRKKIGKNLYLISASGRYGADFPDWETLKDDQQEFFKNKADKLILSIPINGKTIKELIEGWQDGHLRELNPDQSLPEIPFNYEDECREYTSYSKAQQTMRKENWKKVVP